MITKKIILKNVEEAANLFGEYDKNLYLIEKTFNVTLLTRGNILLAKGKGDAVKETKKLIDELLETVRAGGSLTKEHIDSVIGIAKTSGKNFSSEIVYFSEKGKPVKPKTFQQKAYVKAIMRHDIVFSIGPAGTGKTYLACACALKALKEEKSLRIILTRPVVEAGEKLGFLPGDLYEKINPYLHPLFDAFYSMIGPEKFQKLRRDEIIEIIPLAYMRGRTLDDAFIILDEAQNTSSDQMKMFLTRLGFDSQVVITGDITQVDLENKKFSGLIHAQHILEGIKGIKFIYFSEKDVIRHSLVKKIITAYGKHNKRKHTRT